MKTPPMMRHRRDERRHIMHELRADHHVPLKVIGRAAGLTEHGVAWHVHAHFPEHCAVCLEALNAL